MAAPCRFLLLPPELRIAIYRKVFHRFVLQLVDENNFAAYCNHPNLAPNQICRTNRQIRLESVPILASCTTVIAAPILLPYKDGHVDISVKPQVVRPNLSKAFRSNIQAISVSLQSCWVPDHQDYSNLRRVVVDAWLSNDGEPLKLKKDKDLVEMAGWGLVRFGVSEDNYPRWLEDLVDKKSPSVKLALRQVWKIDEDDSESSYLVSLPNFCRSAWC